MSRLVRFKGRAHHLPNDSMKADPVPGIWFVGEKPAHLPERVPCFTELVFDRALAEHCGRACGPDCEGDCFAEMYAGIGPAAPDGTGKKHVDLNEARKRHQSQQSRRRNADLFECLPWPPQSIPAPSPAPKQQKPTRRAATSAAKE